jgi:meckelin
LGTVPDGTNKSCVPCGIPDCAQCSPLGEQLCFNDITPPASLSFSFYNQHLNSWRRLCINRNTSACQIIVNLCVLSLYNKESEACVMAIQLAADQSVKDIIPQLFYPEFGADDYLSTTSIITQFDGKFSHLLIKAAQYSLNGSFIGLTDVMTDEILLCKDRPSKSSASWSVGIRYEIQCVLNSSKLSNEGSQPTFFDLFLLDNNQYLVPIPLLVVTASSANQDEGNIDQWQFVRRFLLYQSLTDTPMYMSSLQMNVQLAGNGHIQPPYFMVTYSPIAGSAVQSTFTVQYESIGNNLNIGLAVSIGVFFLV